MLKTVKIKPVYAYNFNIKNVLQQKKNTYQD